MQSKPVPGKGGLVTRTHGGAVSQEEEDKSIYTYKSIYRKLKCIFLKLKNIRLKK